MKLNPQDAEAYNDLGLAQVQKGDAEGAIPTFQKAAQLRPDDGTLRGNLAIAYLQLDEFRCGGDRIAVGIEARAE